MFHRLSAPSSTLRKTVNASPPIRSTSDVDQQQGLAVVCKISCVELQLVGCNAEAVSFTTSPDSSRDIEPTQYVGKGRKVGKAVGVILEQGSISAFRLGGVVSLSSSAQGTLLFICRAHKEGSHQSVTANRHVRTQDWHAQGQELTGPQQPKRQLSVCIQLEVKLAEALDRCDSLSPPQADDNGQPLPNKLRTAVCCKVCSQCNAHNLSRHTA